MAEAGRFMVTPENSKDEEQHSFDRFDHVEI
jgi:hypothetical protein